MLTDFNTARLIMSKFQEFLRKNSITPSASLPLVHTTSGYNIDELMTSKAIVPRPCNVFIGESLNYFFYGKPSYKISSGAAQAESWEMPVCFVVSFDAISSIKRIYPFDSGAFSNKRYPHYITMMDRDKFEAGTSKDVPARIIGAFFQI